MIIAKLAAVLICRKGESGAIRTSLKGGDMELRPNLWGEARQTIAITPRIIQSIKLLKYGHDDLCAYLREQEEKNPLIDLVLPAPKAPAGQPAEERAPRITGSATAGIGAPSGDLRSIEESFATTVSLRDHLLRQVDLAIRGEVRKRIATEIVESIEPDGYLRRDLEDIAFCLGIDEDRVETVLREVQQFEPTGVGARSLAECLRLQLAETGALTAPMAALLDNLDLLAGFDLPALARICKVDQTEIASMARAIRQLDPRPGKRFDGEPLLPAMPDVEVDLREDGTTHVELNSALLPKVLVNREYYAQMRAAATGEEDTRFVADCMNDATWLTRNLDQRANTLLKVATEIVKRQKAFFRHGVAQIRPLCQGDVADALGLHRSTVCRAISGKYMMTNRGLFELKFFFSNAIASEGKADVSAESLRARIRRMIETETPARVLSDDAIMAQLRNEGVEIARRTVAKYRETMGIPSSSVRRRQLKAARIEAELCPV